MGNETSVEDQIYDLNQAVKNMKRESKKCSDAEKAEHKKLLAAIQSGNLEIARIYAENVIRNKHESINYIRLAARIEAVANRVDRAFRMQNVTQSMINVLHGMEAAIKSTNTEQISELMNKFEQTLGIMTDQQNLVEQTMFQTTKSSTPQKDVDGLIEQVALEHGIEIEITLNTMIVPTNQPNAATLENLNPPTDDLMARFEKLKSK